MFTRHLAHYLGDEEYRALPDALANMPELGDMIPGTGGFRKLRWADARRGKGRRGGLRIIYYWFGDQDQIWFMPFMTRTKPPISPQSKGKH